MSQETSKWLNTQTLIGFTTERGNAWHYRAADQDNEPNHYTGEIPIEDVRRRLFPWHAQAQQMYRAAGYDGSVFVPVAGRKVIVRSDTGADLGVFKDGYEIHQFDAWLLGTLGNILDDGELSIGSAGLLKGGAVAWVSVETPETITTKSGVAFRPHIPATTSHDGSLSTTFKPVVTNVVCDNTMAAGLSEAGPQVKVRHSRYSGFRIAEARDALGIIHKAAEDFQAEVEELTAWKVTDADLSKFLTEWAPMPETEGQRRTMAEGKRAALDLLWRSDERVAPWAGTAWGVLQMANTYDQHFKQVRGVGRVERNMLNAVSGKVDESDAGVLRLLAAITS